VDGSISSDSNESPTEQTLRLIGIGSWLIPVGLLLALIGGILLDRRKPKQAAEG
jgi:hypothetical protein